MTLNQKNMPLIRYNLAQYRQFFDAVDKLHSKNKLIPSNDCTNYQPLLTK